ncbi:Hemicentin-2 [Halotydeus destructor]|nr:Hemicentin-2 [Halotydeus destructor]
MKIVLVVLISWCLGLSSAHPTFRSQRAAIEAPEIVKQSGLVKLQEGAKFSAMCSLSKGTNPVKYAWMRNGSPMQGIDAKIRYIEDLSMTSLTIEMLKTSDAGNYTCRAENSAGQDSHTIQLSIKQTPKWLKEPEDVVAVLGESYSVECAATGSPNPTITWSRLNQPGKQKLFNGNYLKLNEISSGASGLYECVADNGVDEILKKTIRVLVNEREYWYLAPFECLGSFNEMWRWFFALWFWVLKVKMAMMLLVSVIVLINLMSVNGFEHNFSRKISVKARRALDETPEIIKQLNHLELSEKSKFKFMCSLQKGSTPLDFIWLKDGTSLANEYAKITNQQDMSVITIEKLVASDAGNYTCQARNRAGQDSITVRLRVKHTPKWMKEPADMISAIGKDVTVECRASGSPSPAINWFKLNHDANQQISQGEQLKIQSVKQEDVGNYECVADNGVDEPLKKRFKLSVNVDGRLVSVISKSRRSIVEAPEILKQSSFPELPQDSKFLLTCSLNKGSSPVKFSWMKNGSPLSSTTIKIKYDPDMSLTTIFIEKLKSSDAGNYTCKAENSAGRDSHTVQLRIKQTPKWLKEPVDVTTGIGRDVSVECSASGSPTPVVTWFRLNQPKQKLVGGNHLRLNHISSADAGLYECVADNGVDEALKKTIRISVNDATTNRLIYRRSVSEAPQINMQSGNLQLQEEAKFSLFCSLSKGSSPVKFSWLKNSKPIDENYIKILSLEAMSATSLTIEKLKSSDAGNYSCQAQNTAGQDSNTLQLIVKQTSKWLKEPGDITAAVGQDISIECNAVGSPSPVMTWFKLIQSSKRKLNTGRFLRLSGITTEAAGSYECEADNGVDEVLRKTVKVSVNGREVKIVNIEALSMTTLTMEKLESADAGNYTCKAENAVGQDSHTQQLTIKQTLKWVNEPQDVTAAIGQDVSVECGATGSSDLEVSWYKLTKPAQQKLFYTHHLRLNRVTAEAAGLYECVADDRIGGMLKKTIRVSVNGRQDL